MSEPYSAVFQVKIPKSRIMAYLSHAPTLASTWSDWPEIGRRWHSFEYATGLPRLLDNVNRRLKVDNQSCLRALLFDDPAAWRFQYEHSVQTFTFASLLYSENLEDIVLFLSIARSIAAFLDGEDSGFAMVHNYLWGDPQTIAVLGISRSASRFLNNPSSVDAYETSVRRGVTILDQIIQEGPNYDSAASSEQVQSFIR